MPVRTLRLAHRGDWRQAPENSLAALAAALAIPACDGLEFDVRASSDGVPVICHDATLERTHGRPDRVDALSAVALEALGVPTPRRRPDDGRATALPRRRTQGGPRADRRRAAGGRPRPGAVERGRVVLRGRGAGTDRAPRPGLAALAQQPHADRHRHRDGARARLPRDRRELAGAGPAVGRARPGIRARGRLLHRPAPARRSIGSQGSGSWRSASRPAPWRVDPPILPETRRVTDRADLVVVGAGTVGGWASVFAKADGVARVVVLERGLAGMGASSRAAGIVRAQGGTPATVALGRWSIDFYTRPAGRLRHRFRVPPLRLPDPGRDRGRRTSRARARRDAAGGRAGCVLARCRSGRGDRRDALARRSSRGQLRRGRRRDRSSPQRPGLFARDGRGRRRAARADGLHRPADRPDPRRWHARRRGRDRRRGDRDRARPA